MGRYPRGCCGTYSRDGVDSAGAVGIGITGQWGSTVPVGVDGEAVGPCLLWSDTRGRTLAAKRLGGRVNIVGYSPSNLFNWLRLTGGAPSPGGADPLGHHLHLATREPDVYARVETLLEPLDYLGMRFTGRRAATQASMILSWLTDNRPRGKDGYQPGLVADRVASLRSSRSCCQPAASSVVCWAQWRRSSD